MPSQKYHNILEALKNHTYRDARIVLQDQALDPNDVKVLIQAIYAWPEFRSTLTELDISNLMPRDFSNSCNDVITFELYDCPMLRALRLDNTHLVKLKLANLPSLEELSAANNPAVLMSLKDAVEVAGIDFAKVACYPPNLLTREGIEQAPPALSNSNPRLTSSPNHSPDHPQRKAITRTTSMSALVVAPSLSHTPSLPLTRSLIEGDVRQAAASLRVDQPAPLLMIRQTTHSSASHSPRESDTDSGSIPERSDSVIAVASKRRWCCHR
jgi:hypothetical protein